MMAPAVWVHGDCQPAHFILDEASGEVTAVIDWADAQPGWAAMDFAVLTLFDGNVLGWLLEGYGAPANFQDNLARTLPYFRAVRAAGAYRWLETHGYPGHEWPLARIRALTAE
jgi:aminoglycoside phosphotransferase (APT) family kinase protein